VKRGALSTSYRRDRLDRDLAEVCASLRGLILDLGGEWQNRRGNFHPPERADLRWLCLNLEPAVAPDVVGDAACAPLADGCADAVVCSEVLEHVLQPEQVIAECSRLLKPGGHLILSMPFLVGIHADPDDYQRFTASKLTYMLKEAGLVVMAAHKQGLYLTVLAEMLKTLIRALRPTLLRWTVGVLMLPLLSALIRLENYPCLATSRLISSYTTGFFIVAVRPPYPNVGDKS
jgi:SAM-dependent methyltransferase